MSGLRCMAAAQVPSMAVRIAETMITIIQSILPERMRLSSPSGRRFHKRWQAVRKAVARINDNGNCQIDISVIIAKIGIFLQL